MAEQLKKVRIMARVGNPGSGVILQPGTVIDLPAFWADRYIAGGQAEAVTPEPKADSPKPKGKKK